MYYTQKMVITGDFLRHIKFMNFPQKENYEFIKVGKKDRKKSGKIRIDSIKRTRIRISDLVNTNFVKNDKFILFTFRDNVQNIKIANKYFSLFIKRISYYYPDFKYLAVPEFQRRGAVHYHMICKLPYIQKSELEKLWQFGFVKIKRVYNAKNLGFYLSKYLTKDTNNVLFNKKKYFFSKNLDEPIEIVEDLTIKSIFDFYPNMHKLSTVTYSTKYRGDIQYNYYQLNIASAT